MTRIGEKIGTPPVIVGSTEVQTAVERPVEVDADRDPAFAKFEGDYGKSRPAAGGAKLEVYAGALHGIVAAKEELARIVDHATELVRIPSVGGADDPRAICDALIAMLAEAGLDGTLLFDPAGRAAGVICEIAGAKPGPTYVLDAVVDTAPIGDRGAWASDPFAADVREGRMYGRGTADSKIAASIFIELGRELADRSDEMSGRTVLFFDAAEHTGRFEGVKALLEKYPKPDGVLIGYPGDRVACVGSRGFFRAKLDGRVDRPGDPAEIAALLACAAKKPLPHEGAGAEFPLPPKLTITAVATKATEAPAKKDATVFELHLTGVASHSGSSKPSGANAILKAARTLELLAGAGVVVSGVDGGREFSMVPDAVRVSVAGDADVRPRIEAALAQADRELGGDRASTIVKEIAGPATALSSLELNVDVRTTPAFDTDRARRHLAELGLPMHELEPWPAFVLDHDSPLRTAFERGIALTSDHDVPSEVSGPSNVGNLLASFGIPATTGYGVASSGTHGADEWIALDSIPRALAAYRATMHALMGLER